MRALVISGGGSKGAFGGGVAEYLIVNRKINYDIFSGSSTGALITPLLAAGAVDKAREVYTNVQQNDIFSSAPFFVKKKNGVIKTKINHLGIMKMFLKGKKTFGDSYALRDLVRRTFTEEDYTKVLDSGKKVVIAVSNITNNTVEHKYLRDHSYEDFVEWIWISANFTPFMSLVVKNGKEYADGGFGNFIPIREAIDIGATQIDAVVLTPRRKIKRKARSRNAFDLLMNTLDFMLSQIAQDEKYIGLLESINHNLKVRYFHTPRVLTENSLHFDPEEMGAWWEEGIEYARSKCERLGS